MKTWIDQFKPLKDNLGLSDRKEQRQLADEVISVMNSPVGSSHIVAEAGTGTGKSFAYLIPLIHKVSGTDFRGVVSTETLTLQDQVAYKDLPLLQKVYGGFTYMSLKGRSNYLCLTRANVESSGPNANPDALEYLSIIEAKLGQFTEGTLDEIERILGEKVPKDIWSLISGDSDFCQDCAPDSGECFGALARYKAPQHDIVVTNHALLQADSTTDSGILGEHQYVIIDEAHTLEDVFINSLQEDITSWELYKHKKAINSGCLKAGAVLQETGLTQSADYLAMSLDKVMDTIIEFYSLTDDGDWSKSEGILRARSVFAPPGSAVHQAMVRLENDVPMELESLEGVIKSLQKKITDARETLRETAGKKKGVRDLTKAITSLKILSKVCRMIKDTITTRDGIVMDFGVPYVVEYRGWFDDKYSKKRINLSFVPIDVSTEMSDNLWRYDPESGMAQKTCIILSATLTDITDGSFRYVKTSTGFPGTGVREFTVRSPFDYDEQQLIYTTPGTYDLVPVERAQYSLDEAVSLIHAAKGRSLLLFTAKAELEYAADEIRKLGLPYRIMVQNESMSKNELAEEFMRDESSVLLATKSFFTGVNFSGDACSLVIICKFPLKRYTGVCQAQMAWWKGRNFPNWYEMQALTVFRQAVGRLIRSETDRGVVAIIDKRVSSPRERVHHTASMGISTLGSIVTNSMSDIEEFFNADVQSQ